MSVHNKCCNLSSKHCQFHAKDHSCKVFCFVRYFKMSGRVGDLNSKQQESLKQVFEVYFMLLEFVESILLLLSNI